MDYSQAVAISAAGMAAQQARVTAATLNLANMNVSSAPGSVAFRPVTAVIHARTTFADALNSLPLAQAEIVTQEGEATRLSYEPGHPFADAQGMVAYPSVDSTREMMIVVSAMRAYEANLAALQATRALAAKALEIGGQ